MKIKNIIMASLLMLSTFSASAQSQQPKEEITFQPHWYVMLQPLGAQYTLGEVDFGKLITYNVQAAIGYEFNPYVGLRLGINGWQSKGGYDVNDLQYEWKWKYVSPMLDVKFNLSNMFAGFNPNRVFNLSIFGGAGANIGFDNDDAWEQRQMLFNRLGNNQYYVDGFAPFAYIWDGTKTLFNMHFGAIADFRLSDRVAITCELQANTLSDHYNSKKAGNSDWYFNALAGLRINLGKTYNKTIIPPVEPEIRYVEKVVEKVVEKQIPCPETSNAMQQVKEPLRRDIFFTISSVRIDDSEKQKIMDVVNYLNKYPEAKVSVTGYADKGTGNETINTRLSRNRANTVVNELVNKYGIDRSRIVSSFKGDKEQPFAENDKNRVSICIAE